MPKNYFALALVGLLTVPTAIQPTLAGSALQDAMATGATQLSAAEIAELIVGKTVKAKSGKKTFMFHYSDNNVLAGKLVGGNWSGSGYYGITDDNRVCVSMKKDNGRLRCMKVVKQGSAVRKYDVTGKMTFELLEFRDGNQL